MAKLTRRDIIKGSAAAAVGMAVAKVPAATRQPEEKSGGEKSSGARLRFGIIGVGGKGWSGMEQAAQQGDIVALCDTDVRERTRGLMEHPRAASFDDYREMLAAMKGEIDAVVISIPDHHHAVAAAMAMRQGVHTYCEKPLTRTIWEARQLGETARRQRVATQMGNQSTSSTELRKMAAVIKSGHFGRVKEIHLWTDRAAAYWKQGIPRPEVKPAPRELNWDQWLGPRPYRSYGEGYHPFSWRGWWDFGTGALGDMGCHVFNMSFMALDLRDPLSVQAQTSGHNRDSFPEWAMVTYEFGERRGRDPLTLHWYDGGKRPAASLAPDQTYGGNGQIIVTEKAVLYSPNEYGANYRVVGGGEIPDIQVTESPGHMAEFARAAQGGPPAWSNFPDYASPLAETVLLGNLAVWADGPKLEWDARNMRVKGTNEFDSLIRPTFRPGFEV